jgi:hypothetical protein
MSVVMVVLQQWRGLVGTVLFTTLFLMIWRQESENEAKGFTPPVEAVLGLVLGVGGVVRLVRGESLDGAVLLVAGCGLLIVALCRSRFRRPRLVGSRLTMDEEGEPSE